MCRAKVGRGNWAAWAFAPRMQMWGSTLVFALPCLDPATPPRCPPSGATVAARLVPNFMYTWQSFRAVPDGALRNARAEQSSADGPLALYFEMTWPAGRSDMAAIYYGAGPMDPAATGVPGQHQNIPASGMIHTDGTMMLGDER